MAIPRFLRNMFGAGDSDADVEFDDIDRPAPATMQPTVAAPREEQSAQSSDTPQTELPVELLDAILGVINAQLPPVAAQCIDREAQRRYMASVLGQPLADFAEALRRKAVSELTGDRTKMQAELEELRAERKEVSGKREEQKAALLSEQRQRRALSDRNRDLEAKIDELDSQIEQHKLTISSLMNKMRVAEVSEGDTAALREDLDKMRATLKEKEAALKERDEALAAKEQEITALSEKVAAYESASALNAALEQRRAVAGTDEEQEAPAASPKKRRGRQRRQTPTYDPENDASADIDSVDWLLPGGVPPGHTPHTTDPDFGYQPPKHTPAPDSDAQLTLF